MGVGAILFLGLLFLRSKEYVMTTTLVYGELHPKIYGDMIEKLNAVLENRKPDKVAALLGISRAQAGRINHFKATDSRGRPLTDNYTLRKEPLILTVNLSQPIPEDSLRQAVSHYFNSNPFIADRLGLKLKLLREELGYINRKMATIDSVLTNLYSAPPRTGASDRGVTIEGSEGKNAHELLNFSRELMKRKAEIETNLAFPENVIPIDNFLVFPRARLTPGALIKYGLAGVLAGFLTCAFWLFLRLYVRPALEEGEGG